MTKCKFVNSLIKYIEEEYLRKFTSWKPYADELEKERENLLSKIQILVHNVSNKEMRKFRRLEKKK